MLENTVNLSLALAQLLHDLRHTPNSTAWHNEILAILRGDRNDEIENVGSSRQYISRIFADSRSRSEAHDTFHSALRSIVHAWLPEFHNTHYNKALLELIAGFKPSNGAATLLAHLMSRDSILFLPALDHEAFLTNRAALSTLESYWHLPALEATDPAFSIYASLLRKHVETGSDLLVPHCLRRLLELRLLNFSDRVDRALLLTALHLDGVLAEFLQYALGLHRSLLERQVGPVLGLCLGYQNESYDAQPYVLYAHFVDILRRLGACIIDYPRDRPVAVQLNDGTRIGMVLPDDLLKDYSQASSYDADLEFKREWGSQIQQV